MRLSIVLYLGLLLIAVAVIRVVAGAPPAGGTDVRLDDKQQAMLRRHGGDTVTVGFRPEHLAVGKPEGPGLTMSALIDVIEFLGNDELIHGISDERDVVAIVTTLNGLKVGEQVALSAPPTALYFFDPATNMAITPG